MRLRGASLDVVTSQYRRSFMGNQNQNPGQNPSRKAPGQDDKSRRDTNPQNPNDPNRQRTPGAGDRDRSSKKQMQDK
jgi:hypothetical protein